ncbi:Z1 domain-containing protein [Lysobacter cavernae]|uniref:Z1 domain-containing protein n=1 Tax=Lysobacter cavernae TaxID=1685901 RepID=A0ABV7RKC5_9GAMM
MSDPFVTAMGIIGTRDLTEELLADVMAKLALVFPDMDLEPARLQLEARLGLTMSSGEGLTSGENEPWVEDAKASIKWTYWDSYAKQLQSQGFTAPILRAIDEDTDNILTECGNPAVKEGWRIQGLVMGDVQSGKTANYCGLISKAADSGYKVIVLLTGMIEELRSQSQERMDEGFVGRDSNDILDGQQGPFIGAGRYRQVIPNVLTSVSSDFLTANQRSLKGIPLQNLNEPLLLVMKKNTTPLKRLIDFLKHQMHHGATKLDIPLLILDDEADNASVNAKKDEDPARINGLIRELLDQFRRASYVGYTATPFANVFINPDPKRNDLFPSNFIYSLKPPSNYVGAASIFMEDGRLAGQLETITDIEPIIPEKHGKDLELDVLPESMTDAIGVFLISCAIRDLRGEPLKHRSMLINVSRFTDVQARLAEVVKEHLYALVNEVKQYLAADGIWGKHGPLVKLESLFHTHYADCGFGWDEIRAKLYDSVASVKVLTINQKTEAEDKLNYRQYRNTEKGRRVIAIGGLTLSRGLTLEGLCVSYFYRNSKAYDTLLQMGRWFGYRPGYEDLCRIWMTEEAQEWFGHISEVVSELRADIRYMHVNRLPPSRFGIRVRSHPDTLLVTAQNKMRNSDEVEVEASFSGRGIETPVLPRSGAMNAENTRVTTRFLQNLGRSELSGSRHVWRNVPSKDVGAYLQTLSISPHNQAFIADARTGESPLISFVMDNDVESLQTWDICVAQGDGDLADELQFIGPDGTSTSIKKRERQFERPRPSDSIYVKVNKQRVGEIADEKVDLPKESIKKVEDAWRDDSKNEGKRVSGRAYRALRDRPLLTIHPIQPVSPGNPDGKSANRILPTSQIDTDLLLAISLSFPQYEESNKTSVPYRINKVYLRNIGLLDEDEGSDEDLD